MALARPRDAASDGRDLARINDAARRMDKIIGDLLLLARSDAGQLVPTRHPVPLADVLASARDAVSGPDHAPVLLDPLPASLCVLGDAESLIRLFVSLLDNAVRYSPPGEPIHVCCAADAATVTVTVVDRGPGIAPEHLPHVCERFYRADPARTRRGDSTGLGLAIAQSIAEAHGGTLTLQSAPGTGTQAVVTLPLEKYS
jgi:signal transduction histidine kinase